MSMKPLDAQSSHLIQEVRDHADKLLADRSFPPLPASSAISASTAAICKSLPSEGTSLTSTIQHILNDLTPGLNGNSLSPNYYGFVTGGATPAAQLADNLVSLYDQNVQVHLPDQTITTVVEDRALSMLLELFNLEPEEWPSRTLTTGATGGNILGLAVGREFVLQQALKRAGKEGKVSVGDDGLFKACREAGVEEINLLTTMGHSSFSKAAGVLGLGRRNVKSVAKEGKLLEIDLKVLEGYLRMENSVSIVAISCGEVNTGGFATHSVEEIRAIKELCERYRAWLHVDGAFGLFARSLPNSPEFAHVISGCAGLELVDSIAGDGHKLLNVPYDCGFFFCRHKSLPSLVFQNPNAAYLSSSADAEIASPLNIGMENSRRFRGLPVYATLMAYGRDGYVDMLQRQIRFAREVAKWISEDKRFELLPRGAVIGEIFIVVLFRATNEELNNGLVKSINNTTKVYVSGTSWDGKPAARIAVSNWQVDVARDLEIVTQVLRSIANYKPT